MRKKNLLKKIRLFFLVLVICAVVFTAAAYFLQSKKCVNDDLNVILIVLDTVRADHMTSYGAERDTTPFIDRLAKQSTLFTNAYSTSCWTLPSHGSLFTGRYAFSHGATQEHLYLEDTYTTLAERLSLKDYQTVAFSANPLVGDSTNMLQGFDRNYQILTKKRKKTFFQNMSQAFNSMISQHPLNASMKKWWALKYKPNKPFFIFFNYMDAHSPYKPPRRYAKMMVKKEDIQRINEIPQDWPLYYTGEIQYTAEDFELLNSLYDAEIRYLDDAVKDLVLFLEKRNALKNTLLIITSDHGENIGDHGLIDHVFALYNTTLHIPLIIKHPILFPEGAECSAPVQINDLFKTILAVCQIQRGIKQEYLYSLLPENWSNIPDSRLLFSEYFYPKQALSCFAGDSAEMRVLERFRRSLRSAQIQGIKAIEASNGRNEFFDLKMDPAETQNLYSSGHEDYHLIKARMDKFIESLPKATELKTKPKFSKKEIERLKALGYMK
jgi:predicted AlkP superfamily pyrophosphatase or phosphodiesterase